MVAVKPTQKRTKKSYKERVLKAVYYTSVGKRGVHYNSIRAQVRKNAEEIDDMLGPNWNGWIRKTVKQLDEDAGMLDATDVTNIFLTPKGRKRISAERRAFGFPDRDCDDVVWKQLAAGTKRSRDGRGDNADSLSSPRAKKARRSSGTTSLSRRTKAQLLEEIDSLRRTNDELQSSSAHRSPSTEGTESRRLLQEREAEIAALKSQLDQATQQRVMDVDYSLDEPHGNMFATPSATPAPSSPQGEPRTPTPPPVRPGGLIGLTRVQSGSFINNISKQPTPDPGTPRHSQEATPGWDGFDTFDDANGLEADMFGSHGSSNNLPITPDPSPGRPISDPGHLSTSKLSELLEKTANELRDKEAEMERLLAAQDDSACISEELSQTQFELASLREQVDDLERDLVERDMVISFQDADLVELAASKDVIEQSLTALSARFVQAQKSLVSHEQTILGLNANASELSNQVHELERALALAEADGSERVAQEVAIREAIQHELEQLKLNAAALQARYDGSTSQVNGLRGRLQNAEDLARDHLRQLSATEQAMARVKEELRRAVSTGDTSLARVQELEDQNAQLQARLQDQLDSSQATITSLQTELRQSSLELQRARDDHTKTIDALNEAITERDAAIERGNRSTRALTHELESLRTNHSRVSTELATAKERIRELQDLGNKERARSTTLQCDLGKSQRLLEDANEEILDYRAAKAQDDSTIASLKAGFTRLREIQMQSLTQLAGEIESAHTSPVKKSRRSI